MKQKVTELKGRIDNSTRIVEDFNTAFPVIDKNNWTDQQGNRRYEQHCKLIRYNTSILNSTQQWQNIVFSSTHRIFYRTDHKVGHRTSLSKFKKDRNNTKHVP